MLNVVCRKVYGWSQDHRWLRALWFTASTLKNELKVKNIFNRIYSFVAFLIIAMLGIWYLASYVMPCADPILDECPSPGFFKFWLGIFGIDL